MEKLIGNRYSKALFSAGTELNKNDVFFKELNFVKEVLTEEAGLFELLKHPRVSYDEKKQVVKNVFKDFVSPEILNLFYIVIDKRREVNIIEIIDSYNELYYDFNNILDMTAITAVPMEDKHKEKLISKLESELGKSIKLQNKIDKSILGGVILEASNMRIDGSIKGKILNMKNELDSIVM